MFPPSLLARLFVQGSLKNTPNGYEFKLKNIIDSGTITGLGPLTVGDVVVDAAHVCIRMGEVDIPGDKVTRERPIYARAGSEVLISVQGDALPPGPHKISLTIYTLEAGKLMLTITEPLAA